MSADQQEGVAELQNSHVDPSREDLPELNTSTRLDQLATPKRRASRSNSHSRKEVVLNFTEEEQRDAEAREQSLRSTLSGEAKRSPRQSPPREIIGKDGKPIEVPQPNYGRVINFTEEQERDAAAQRKTSPRKKSVKTVVNPKSEPVAVSPGGVPAKVSVRPTRTPVGQHSNDSIDRLSQPKRRSDVEKDAVLNSFKNKRRSSYGGTTVVSPLKKEGGSSPREPQRGPSQRPTTPRGSVTAQTARQQPIAPVRTPPPPARAPRPSGGPKTGAKSVDATKQNVVAATVTTHPNKNPMRPPMQVKTRRFTPKEETPQPDGGADAPQPVAAAPVYAAKRKTPGTGAQAQPAPTEKRETSHAESHSPSPDQGVNKKGTKTVFKAPPTRK
ncbi:hypothetical protein, conserved [Angomonas deanei]|uniref:Uncharacterized protein n=1 Tax=Angomonas deanei TaxID=59799 RepID=A0A7G2CJ38_9TRYP|nr:hypothetical protein, conserved [Angomonas deanei]